MAATAGGHLRHQLCDDLRGSDAFKYTCYAMLCCPHLGWGTGGVGQASFGVLAWAARRQSLWLRLLSSAPRCGACHGRGLCVCASEAPHVSCQTYFAAVSRPSATP